MEVTAEIIIDRGPRYHLAKQVQGSLGTTQHILISLRIIPEICSVDLPPPPISAWQAQTRGGIPPNVIRTKAAPAPCVKRAERAEL